MFSFMVQGLFDCRSFGSTGSTVRLRGGESVLCLMAKAGESQ